MGPLFVEPIACERNGNDCCPRCGGTLGCWPDKCEVCREAAIAEHAKRSQPLVIVASCQTCKAIVAGHVITSGSKSAEGIGQVAQHALQSRLVQVVRGTVTISPCKCPKEA